MSLRIPLFVLVLAAAVPAAAQSTRPAPIVEGSGGWTAFIDDSWIHHSMLGAGGRVFLLPRLAVGPELVLLFGDEHYDWFLNAEATLDLRRDSSDPGTGTPYLFAAYGYGRLVPTADRSFPGRGSWGAAFGFGTRIAATRRFFVAREVRLITGGSSLGAVGLGVAVGMQPGR